MDKIFINTTVSSVLSPKLEKLGYCYSSGMRGWISKERTTFISELSGEVKCLEKGLELGVGFADCENKLIRKLKEHETNCVQLKEAGIIPGVVKEDKAKLYLKETVTDVLTTKLESAGYGYSILETGWISHDGATFIFELTNEVSTFESDMDLEHDVNCAKLKELGLM